MGVRWNPKQPYYVGLCPWFEFLTLYVCIYDGLIVHCCAGYRNLWSLPVFCGNLMAVENLG